MVRIRKNNLGIEMFKKAGRDEFPREKRKRYGKHRENNWL
jgi:hypothetical protein